jgi:hypothetical protein
MKIYKCLFCAGKLDYSFYPFCSVKCQKDYESFYNCVLQHRKKGDLTKWINKDLPDRLNLYARFKLHKAAGISYKLPHKKPLYFLAGY